MKKKIAFSSILFVVLLCTSVIAFATDVYYSALFVPPQAHTVSTSSATQDKTSTNAANYVNSNSGGIQVYGRVHRSTDGTIVSDIRYWITGSVSLPYLAGEGQQGKKYYLHVGSSSYSEYGTTLSGWFDTSK